MSEAEIIEKIRALRTRGKTDEAIRRELGLGMLDFYYLLGRAGLPRRFGKQKPGVTHVTVCGRLLSLWVARSVLRQTGWKKGQGVRWRIERGRLVGEPIGPEE